VSAMTPAGTEAKERRIAAKPAAPPAESPAFMLARLGRVAARLLNDELAEIGLKPPEAAILIMLRDHGPVSQQELGERLRIDPSNLVSFLNALEHDGLLVRRRDPADRRRHIVEITKLGAERVPRCEGPVAALENQLFATLSRGDREQFRRILAELLVAMPEEEVPGDRDEEAA
jgi:DNA-binding MarR family transcriptional regulator